MEGDSSRDPLQLVALKGVSDDLPFGRQGELGGIVHQDARLRHTINEGFKLGWREARLVARGALGAEENLPQHAERGVRGGRGYACGGCSVEDGEETVDGLRRWR